MVKLPCKCYLFEQCLCVRVYAVIQVKGTFLVGSQIKGLVFPLEQNGKQ